MQIEIFHDFTYDNWQPERAYGWQIRDGERIVGYHYHAAPSEAAARAMAEQSSGYVSDDEATIAQLTAENARLRAELQRLYAAARTLVQNSAPQMDALRQACDRAYVAAAEK